MGRIQSESDRRTAILLGNTGIPLTRVQIIRQTVVRPGCNGGVALGSNATFACQRASPTERRQACGTNAHLRMIAGIVNWANIPLAGTIAIIALERRREDAARLWVDGLLGA